MPEPIRTSEARAWDEGYRAAQDDAENQPYSDAPGAADWKPTPNPYVPRNPPHDHEAWQIRDNSRGGRYCAACGQEIPTIPQTTTPTNPELWS